MSQHTPWPWRYERQNGSPTTGEHMIAGGLPGYLAEVRDCGSGDVAANARLIASAPELLEALETIAAIAVGNGMVCEIIARRARFAIAKAAGEAA